MPASFLPKVYFAAVNKAGGIAVLLPPQPVDPDIANAVLDGLDGIIITGGKDVDARPLRRGTASENDDPRTDRDAWEDALLTAAIDRGVPFLGICRGMQLLNVSPRRHPRSAPSRRDRVEPVQPRRGQLQPECGGRGRPVRSSRMWWAARWSARATTTRASSTWATASS